MSSKLLNKSALVLSFTFAGLSLFMNCSYAPQQEDNNSKEISVDVKSESSQTDQDLPDDTTTQTAEEVKEFWTEERLRDAKPMPFPEAIVPEDNPTDESLPSEVNPVLP